MVVTTGLGEVYQDRFDQLSRQFRPAEEGSDDLSSGRKQSNLEPKDDPKEQQEMSDRDFRHFRFDQEHQKQTPKPPKIDQNHHVPLVASAITDDDGNMTGMAVDHRIDLPKEYAPFLALHENAEVAHMKNLIAAGMKPQEAYHEAHDKIATPIETAAVRAHAANNGLDPDVYHEAYKQFFRDAASVAKDPSDQPRHPDAHTTKYGLDESELDQKYAMLKPASKQQILAPDDLEPEVRLEQEEHKEEKNILRTQPQHGLEVEPKKISDIQHPPLEMDVLGAQLSRGHGIYAGPIMGKVLQSRGTANENTNVREFEPSKNTEPKLGEKGKVINFSEGEKKVYYKQREEEHIKALQEGIKSLSEEEHPFERMQRAEQQRPDWFKYYRAVLEQRGGKEEKENLEKYDEWKELGKLQETLQGMLKDSERGVHVDLDKDTGIMHIMPKTLTDYTNARKSSMTKDQLRELVKERVDKKDKDE